MLPDSRNTTYVGGVSQVKSADLNDIQDKIVDLSTLVRGTRLVPFGTAAMAPADPTMWEMDFASGLLCRKRSAASGGTDAYLFADLPLVVGDRLVSFVVYVYEFNSLTANRTYAAWTRDDMAGFAPVSGGSFVISAGASAAPASMTSITVAGANQSLAQAYHRIGIAIKCKTSGALISGGHAVIDHP